MGLVVIFPVGLVSSCDIEMTNDFGGAGSFYVVNVSTQDTMKAGESTLYPKLSVKKGDEITLFFIPADKYVKYSFKVIYMFSDSTKVAGKGKDYNYSFVLDEVNPGEHAIYMSAESTEQMITSSGKVALKVIE